MQVDPYAATNALSEGFNQQQAMAQSRARRMAGNALAGGNTQAAMSALGGAGDLAGQRVLQNDMTAEADAVREQEQAEIQARRTWMLKGVTALEQAPPDQVQDLWMTQLRPVMAAMGMGEDELRQLDAADKSPQSLRAVRAALGGDVPSLTANDRMSGGNVIRPDPYTGEYGTVYDAPAPAPNLPTGWMMNEDGSISPRPGYVQGQRELSAAGRAPPRPRASSGVGGSARPGSSGQAAPAPTRRPWERY